MKKIISTALALSLALGIAGCGKSEKSENTGEKHVTKIGDTVIDEVTYNFFYDNVKSQITDESEAVKTTNQEIIDTFMPTEVGKKLNLTPDTKDELMNQIRGGASDEQYQQFLTSKKINDEFMDKYLEAVAYNTAIAKYVNENDTEKIDERQFFKDNYLRAKHVLFLTQGLPEKEAKEKENQANEIYERAKKGENFDELINQYSEDPGSKSQPDGYIFTDGDMVTEFYEGTKNIGIGEFNLVKSSYGYHIIQRLALDETPELFEKFFSETDVTSRIEQKKATDFIKQKSEEFNIKVTY